MRSSSQLSPVQQQQKSAEFDVCFFLGLILGLFLGCYCWFVLLELLSV